MTRRIGVDHDGQRLPTEQEAAIIQRVQAFCADIVEKRDGKWTLEDGIALGNMFNESDDAFDLFTFVDEKTGHWMVGYRTDDGREWFHILRQMRNQPGSGLLETMRGPYAGHNAAGGAQ